MSTATKADAPWADDALWARYQDETQPLGFDGFVVAVRLLCVPRASAAVRREARARVDRALASEEDRDALHFHWPFVYEGAFARLDLADGELQYADLVALCAQRAELDALLRGVSRAPLIVPGLSHDALASCAILRDDIARVAAAIDARARGREDAFAAVLRTEQTAGDDEVWLRARAGLTDDAWWLRPFAPRLPAPPPAAERRPMAQLAGELPSIRYRFDRGWVVVFTRRDGEFLAMLEEHPAEAAPPTLAWVDTSGPLPALREAPFAEDPESGLRVARPSPEVLRAEIVAMRDGGAVRRRVE